MEPFEIIAAPFTMWVAPVGTAFPEVDEAPGGGWTKVGTSGDRNYTEEGVTGQHQQTLEKFRAAGSTGPRKIFRTEEELIFALTLADISLEQYKLALNGNTITTVAAAAGTPGTKSIGLSRGSSVAEYAVLIRGISPYDEDLVMQYEVPRAVQSGSPSPVFRKGEPAALALEWTALEDDNAASDDERFGRLVAQTDPAI